ncbi:MAG TPA: hypothetical protein VMU07_01965 [Candidatus Paceibacterota bacterium]|nr:hypothetical protein [Candidatus Paceibacterota bacterium]
MSGAIAFAAFVIVAAVLMPDVLRALEVFLLALFGKATAFLNNLPASPAMTAQVSRTLPQ